MTDSIARTRQHGNASAAARSRSLKMPTNLSAAEALEELKAGNARFAAGVPHAEPFNSQLAELTGGQSPFAIVLGCSDSRVPTDIIFDQTPGSLFVVRVAGNFLDSDGLGSIEFAVDYLKSKLIVVLGHENCGAVDLALKYVRDGTGQPGYVQELINAIAPAVREARDETGDWYENAIARNVKRNVDALTEKSSIIADAVNRREAKVAGGIYSVRTGLVTFKFKVSS
jgi:carbonic anhydrase